MRRPTIRDLATAAGVSIATVNRVIGGSGAVRQSTMRRVHDAAEATGFDGLGAIKSRVSAVQDHYDFGFLLHQPTRPWYQNVARALKQAAEDRQDCQIKPRIEFLDDLAPQTIAERMLALGQTCGVVAVVSAVHPVVSQAVKTLQQHGVSVVALISPLSATAELPFVGLDNWKVGRTSAWAFAHICKAPGKLGILVGNHRYQCQEMNESGFRSYFRECAPGFTLLEPLSTFESRAIAQDMTEKLLHDHPDIVGLYVSGGGITGAVTALSTSDRAGQITVVGYELMDVTRQALVDGILTLVISHPLARLAEETIAVMIRAVASQAESANLISILPFDIYTRENI
ncbi:MAG: LacI family DNA-binding transcriptional regulator [Acetobacteraceae bacterium]